ncbi:hypothetical protein AOG23_23800 [Rhizobium acidisoli]|nr:hypothetical protein AOG23_23800 [Rhizobium acidisoli]
MISAATTFAQPAHGGHSRFAPMRYLHVKEKSICGADQLERQTNGRPPDRRDMRELHYICVRTEIGRG